MERPLDLIVLDNQQPLGARGSEFFDPIESRLQAERRGRLDKIGKGAVSETVLAFLLQRDDLHGNVTCARIELQLVEHRPPKQVGQKNVEGYRRGVVLPGEGHANSALGRDDALEPLVARQPEEDARIVRSRPQ